MALRGSPAPVCTLHLKWRKMWRNRLVLARVEQGSRAQLSSPHLATKQPSPPLVLTPTPCASARRRVGPAASVGGYSIAVRFLALQGSPEHATSFAPQLRGRPSRRVFFERLNISCGLLKKLCPAKTGGKLLVLVLPGLENKFYSSVCPFCQAPGESWFAQERVQRRGPARPDTAIDHSRNAIPEKPRALHRKKINLPWKRRGRPPPSRGHHANVHRGQLH